MNPKEFNLKTLSISPGHILTGNTKVAGQGTVPNKTLFLFTTLNYSLDLRLVNIGGTYFVSQRINKMEIGIMIWLTTNLHSKLHCGKNIDFEVSGYFLTSPFLDDISNF